MLPDVQLSLRPGIVDFSWGHPDPSLLPAADMARATAHALAEAGPLALSYGAEQGPGRLIEQMCSRWARLEGAAPDPEQVFITGGISQGLDLLCSLLTRPGDVALVESPVYHLALRIFRDHRLDLVPVAGDEQGLRADALEAQLVALARTGRKASFLYTVPTFGNPSGTTLPLDRRAQVLAQAGQAGLIVLEDDVYRELWYDAVPPPAMFRLAGPATVVRLGSFSKVLAPGLRLGWLMAPAAIVRRCTGSGVLDSGGGVNHFTAHAVAAYLALGLLDAHVERLRNAYRPRRDALLDALARYLPPGIGWVRPGGGFFIWVCLPEGIDSGALLPAAEAAGVSYLPGRLFCSDGGGQRYLRLAFALLPAAELEEGARRLGNVIATALAGR